MRGAMTGHSFDVCGLYWVIRKATRPICANLGLLAFLNGTLSVVGFLLNLLSLIVMWKSHHLDTSSRLVLFNLGLCDLLKSLVSQTVYTGFLITQVTGKIVCELAVATGYLGTVFLLISFQILVIITTERYINIFYPFRRSVVLTEKRMYILFGWIWCSGFVLPIIYFTARSTERVLLILAVVIHLIGILWMLYVHLRAFHKSWKIRRVINVAPALPMRVNIRQKIRGLKYTGVLVIVSVIFCGPYPMLWMLILLSKPSQSWQLLTNWLYTLVLLNSTVNPLCYFLLDKKIRTSFARKVSMIQERFNLTTRNSRLTSTAEVTVIGKESVSSVVK